MNDYEETFHETRKAWRKKLTTAKVTKDRASVRMLAAALRDIGAEDGNVRDVVMRRALDTQRGNEPRKEKIMKSDKSSSIKRKDYRVSCMESRV